MENASQNCLNEAYTDQLKMVELFENLILKIKLNDGTILNIQPTCNFDNNQFNIDFSNPLKTKLANVEYKSSNDTATALVDYCKDNECDDNFYKNKINNEGIYNKLNALMEKKIFLNGELNIHNFYKCHNEEQNSWVFITLTSNFKPLKRIQNIDFNKLEILSNQLNNNNIKNIYFFNKNIEILDFVISNNYYVVYIEDFDEKEYNDYGLADSCAMYKILSLHDKYDSTVKAQLDDLYLTCYNKLTDKQKENFEIEFKALL